jgi:Spy/CpxP family protein refolding chaperone
MWHVICSSIKAKNKGGLDMEKRTLNILGIGLLVAALAIPVFAFGHGWVGHPMMGAWGGGPGYGGHHGLDYGNLTTEQRSRLEKLDRTFYDQTADLRNELWKKTTELDALLSTTDPDLGKVKALQKDISDIRAKLDEKQLNHELEARKITPDIRLGAGYGHPMGGYSPGTSYSPGTCWN